MCTLCTFLLQLPGQKQENDSQAQSVLTVAILLQACMGVCVLVLYLVRTIKKSWEVAVLDLPSSGICWLDSAANAVSHFPLGHSPANLNVYNILKFRKSGSRLQSNSCTVISSWPHPMGCLEWHIQCFHAMLEWLLWPCIYGSMNNYQAGSVIIALHAQGQC